MLKIEKQKLVDFLDKIKMGNNVIEVLFKFTNEGLEINTIDQAKIALVNAKLKKESFIEYEELGEVGIQNLQEIILILKSFGEEINIQKRGNLLVVFEDNYKLETELVSTEFIEEVPEAPELIFNEKAEMDSNEINLFIKNIGINRTFSFNIETENKKIILSNKGKYKFTKEINSDIIIGGFKGSYGILLKDIMPAFTEKIIFKMNKDEKEGYPLEIYEKTLDSEISIILAPIINKD
jgi:hypothetical protein